MSEMLGTEIGAWRVNDDIKEKVLLFVPIPDSRRLRLPSRPVIFFANRPLRVARQDLSLITPCNCPRRARYIYIAGQRSVWALHPPCQSL